MFKNSRYITLLMVLVFSSFFIWGCKESDATDNDDWGIDEEIMPDEEKLGKADSAWSGGPATIYDSSNTAVWEITNNWEDTDTPEARKPGIVWGDNSGLNWDEKYALWVQSMGIIPGYEVSFQTFMLKTPWGKELPAPRLECAEVAMFLRVTFASWYNLPFFLKAVDSSGAIYFGHMGARTSTGRYKNTPLYKTSYKDYSKQFEGKSNEYIVENWPQDSLLRKRSVGQGDTMEFLTGSGTQQAGQYFDEIFLNKRTGHFLRLLLAYFGSVNLASSSNTYNLKPQSVRGGDILVHRWQRTGIGHVMVIKNVTDIEGGKKEAIIVSGSMPRRQPKYETPTSSKEYLTSVKGGGPGENWDGDSYASLGGGLKRFRVAKVRNGKWANTWMNNDEASWINDTDHERISARIEEFDDLLGEVEPEQLRTAYLQMIEDARNHLRQYPASCAARNRREEAFEKLYEVNGLYFNMERDETDMEYRIFDDYVFARLVYQESKTCCWNRSTSAMYQIIMDYNNELQQDECTMPVVFKAENGGYEVFRQYAEDTDRGYLWADWSEDEHCPQNNVLNDTEVEHTWVEWCEFGQTPVDPECTDIFEPNNSPESAEVIEPGSYEELKICSGDEDYFWLNASADFSVTIDFVHSDGDLDLALYQNGTNISTSQSTEDSETVQGTPGEYIIRVYGYNGAQGEYTLKYE
ncbi:MAG: PPC domain-containing protein [Deltaproteobacteria bacterium]|jgi:hypothetical protein|nr:PPC domain-containing protein [Deltaproteobacteria bacterium]